MAGSIRLIFWIYFPWKSERKRRWGRRRWIRTKRKWYFQKKLKKIISIPFEDEIINKNGRNKNENDYDEEKTKLILLNQKKYLFQYQKTKKRKILKEKEKKIYICR